MSDAVDSAIAEKQNLIAESGTGTGKTFAYLVPSLLSEKKIIISTRTKNLQEQLFRQDVGLVCEALGPERQRPAAQRSRKLFVHSSL